MGSWPKRANANREQQNVDLVPQRRLSLAPQWDGRWNFFEHGARQGQTLSRCQETEITWAKMLAGDEGTLPGTACQTESGVRRMTTASSLPRCEFWQHHAHALNLAEGHDLARDHAVTYAPGKPSLAADAPGQLTDVKLGGNRISARGAPLAVDEVVKIFRAEELSR
jgi:hypothetical protein